MNISLKISELLTSTQKNAQKSLVIREMQMKTKMRNPMERGAWQAIIHGVARVRHDSETKPPPLHIYYRVKIKKSKMLNITYKPAILSVHPKEMKTQVHKLGCT